ncbi:hypothetical protein MBCUT_15600 [Methanobrevibacter cuticularis]|uniref:Uncharacterized protein n=1 Tax=Methanobrevibacter cuticularis TaxID=47311 RepID=A0A166D9J6_9EURY|nr:hypothetical protein [Methanobrevibacter cuticularis]KZX15346.1 hypothetical protein MBCUT_15600 [Methanobrevibacter cuticularis]
MKFKILNNNSEDLSIEDITEYLNDLKSVDSFFILEKGDCSYIQCINYKGFIIIEERVYKEDSFRHYILGHKNHYHNNTNNITNLNSINNSNNNTNNTDTINNIENYNFENNLINHKNNELFIDDENFKVFITEIFSIRETIDLFIDYYCDISLTNIKRRDITSEFSKVERGFVFIQWLPSAVATFKESLEEFIIAIEPFVVDELKKDCIGKKIAIFNKDNGNEDLTTYCSAFKVMDIHWAAESIIEIAEKYEFLEDINLYKKSSIENKKFSKLNIEDFKK